MPCHRAFSFFSKNKELTWENIQKNARCHVVKLASFHPAGVN